MKKEWSSWGENIRRVRI